MNKGILAATAGACFLLTGCGGLPTAREMEQGALICTMGLDREGEQVAVLALAEQADGEQTQILTAQGSSLSAACENMERGSGTGVFFGHVEQLLVGNSAAEEGILPELDFLSRDKDLSLGVELWLAGDTSAARAFAENETPGTAAVTRTAGEVYSELLERGCALVPVLGGEEYGMLRRDGLAGYLTGEAARGTQLLEGKAEGDVLQLTAGETKAAVRILQSKTRVVLSEDERELTVVCVVTAQLVQTEENLSQEERETLRCALQQRETSRVQEALAQMQGWNLDGLGLYDKGLLASPLRWLRFGAGERPEFESVTLHPQIQVRLLS
jgi:hypothetical protein